MAARRDIGATDFWYKLDHGHRDDSHARDSGVARSTDRNNGYIYMRPLWDDIVRRYLAL